MILLSILDSPPFVQRFHSSVSIHDAMMPLRSSDDVKNTLLQSLRPCMLIAIATVQLDAMVCAQHSYTEVDDLCRQEALETMLMENSMLQQISSPNSMLLLSWVYCPPFA